MSGILKALNQRPIAYYPIYREITGSTTAGILLSQLMYWFAKKDKFHKSDNDIMDETLLTEKELRTAKTKIKNLDFISVTREGIPATTYYEIEWEMYQTCFAHLGSTVSPKGRNCDSPKGETTLYTSKTTTKKEEKEEYKNIKKFLDEIFLDQFSYEFFSIQFFDFIYPNNKKSEQNKIWYGNKVKQNIAKRDLSTLQNIKAFKEYQDQQKFMQKRDEERA